MGRIDSYDEISILGGQIVQRIKAENDEVAEAKGRVLIPKAIDDGVVNLEYVALENLKTLPDDKKMTKEGDIVVKLSTPYDSCLIEKEHENLIIPSFCAVIRGYENIFDPYYLLAFLNSERCKYDLEKETVGVTMRLLSPGIIKKVSIPEIEKEKQVEIGKKYKRYLEINKTMKKIVALEKEYFNAVIDDLED